MSQCKMLHSHFLKNLCCMYAWNITLFSTCVFIVFCDGDGHWGRTFLQINKEDQWDLPIHCPWVVVSCRVCPRLLAFIQHLTACLMFPIFPLGVLVTRTQVVPTLQDLTTFFHYDQSCFAVSSFELWKSKISHPKYISLSYFELVIQRNWWPL